eukprot:scaffold27386_cov28-Tisochrysis_lutea.AAC.1
MVALPFSRGMRHETRPASPEAPANAEDSTHRPPRKVSLGTNALPEDLRSSSTRGCLPARTCSVGKAFSSAMTCGREYPVVRAREARHSSASRCARRVVRRRNERKCGQRNRCRSAHAAFAASSRLWRASASSQRHASTAGGRYRTTALVWPTRIQSAGTRRAAVLPCSSSK